MDCKFYLHGKCSKGGACEFRHNAMVKAEYEAGIAKDCTFFAGGRGKCARLETCRFLHLPAANHDASGAAIGDTDVRDHDMGRRPDRRHDALGGGRVRTEALEKLQAFEALAVRMAFPVSPKFSRTSMALLTVKLRSHAPLLSNMPSLVADARSIPRRC